ncbi:hypothetical protein EDD11_007318 [Mortierella claussenii]|nr:hypothetical protein EDD11_007318 [Mortierella claussenii]
MQLTLSNFILGLASLLGLLASVDAGVIEGRLLGVSFRGRIVRGVSMKTKILLNSGLYETHIQKDGTFVLSDVPEGTYMLEVRSPHLSYSKVRVSVTKQDVVATRVSLGDHFSDYQEMLPMPLVLRPKLRPAHYILVLMPKIMANLAAAGVYASLPFVSSVDTDDTHGGRDTRSAPQRLFPAFKGRGHPYGNWSSAD